jgi:cytochrome P450
MSEPQPHAPTAGSTRDAREPFLFNPLDPGTRHAPWALYERGRREHPVLAHAGLPLPVYSVFRYADVQEILRDPETWSNFFPLRGELAERGEIGEARPPSMLGTDPPEHTRLRSLVNKAFTPRIVQRLEPRMREIADELLAAAVERGEVDLVQALTYPLPVTVIAEIIGIPADDRARFKTWSDEAVSSLGTVFMTGADPERFARQERLFEEMRSYLIPLAEARRSEPREDLLTGLVRAEHEGSKLTHDEMISMVVLLLVAGNETTTTLIGNAVLELLAHPEAERRLRAEPALLPTAIEEVLRFSSPVQFDPRRATRRVTLHGVEIPEDAFVLCWLGSANRDEEVFDHPAVFDVTRRPNNHIAFGFGPHYCLGANLARLEAQVAVGTLLDHTRRFERVDDAPLPLHPSPVFRGVTSLPLRLEGA